MADFAEASQLSSVLGVTDTSGVEGLTVATFVYARGRRFSPRTSPMRPPPGLGPLDPP